MNFFKELSEGFSKGFNSEKNHENQIEDKEKKLEEEINPVKENEDVKEIDIENNREIKVQKTLEYFNLPSDTTFPIDGITELSDEELKEKFDELIKPFNLILDELIIKQKEWMPDDEKEAYESLIADLENPNYFPTSDENLKWASEDFQNWELVDFIENILFGKPVREVPDIIGIKIIDETNELIRSLSLKILKIIWSFFGVKADLLRVEKLCRIYFVEDMSREEKAEWESYQKQYFYHDKKQVKRIIDLCLTVLDIHKQHFIEDDAEEEALTEDYENQDISDISMFGYVYFIRNKDIYKIGITQNMLQRMDQLKPDELLDSVRCSNYRKLEKDIHKEFKACRIPQTEYFRLDKKQINQIHKMLSEKAKS